jgi:hypothetical protein
MPTLNRFPLLGLWAKEAALRLGYPKDEAESLGHAYAVLYAIRSQSTPRPRKDKEQEAEEQPAGEAQKTAPETVDFCGDHLEITRDAHGHLRGWVGGGAAQTPRTYRASVAAKYPTGYHDRLEQAFHEVWQTIASRTLTGRLVYKLYDQWKKTCAVGRLVDLDKLLRWCQERTRAAPEQLPGKV